MAVTERGGGPATASGTGAVSVTLTGTRQPQTDDWLVIVHHNDFYALSNMSTPTVGGSTSGVSEITGTGLPADGGTNFAHTRAYKKKITSGGSDLTVALVETGSADEDKAIAVWVLSGADTTDCVDIAAGAFDSTNTPTTQRIAPSTSPGTAGYLLVATNDGGGASSAPYTPPSGMTERYDGTTGGMGYSGAVLQLGASGATGTKIFTVANTAAAYAAISIVVKPAAGSTVNGTATMAGAGTLTANAVQTATATPAAAGALTANAVQRVTAALSAVSTLAATAVQKAIAALTGSATAAANTVQIAPATATAAGALTASATTSGAGTATISAAATLSATATVKAPAALTAASALTATASVPGQAERTITAQTEPRPRWTAAPPRGRWTADEPRGR